MDGTGGLGAEIGGDNQFTAGQILSIAVGSSGRTDINEGGEAWESMSSGMGCSNVC